MNVNHTLIRGSIIRPLCVLLTLLLLVSCASPKKEGEIKKGWAQPITLHGVPNLHQVSPSIYRGGQPSAIGMQELEKHGIKTVINLRTFHTNEDEVGNTPIHTERIKMLAWNPKREDAVRFLQLATNPQKAPVLIHCWHGSDRTGTMTALYRIIVQNWSKEEAIAEMTSEHYGFHSIFSNIPEWIRALDIAQLKQELSRAGTSKPQKSEMGPTLSN